MIPTLIGITFITFILMKLAPGDPVSLKLQFATGGLSPQEVSKELENLEDPIKLPAWYKNMTSWLSLKISGKPEGTKVEKIFTSLGKNSVLYFKWIKGIATFNFGYSTQDQRPVLDKIKEALPITLALNIISIFIVYLISIPVGIWSALNKNSLLDKIVMIKFFILYALPEFWIGTLLLIYFAGGEHLSWFPLTGYQSDDADQLSFLRHLVDISWHLFLPVVVYVYGSFAFLSRFSRSNFLEVIRQDYMRTAMAKGLSKGVVLWKHGFRNSLIPLVTLMGTLLPALLGGSVIIEQIFSIPGMGMLSFQSILSRDYNLIMGIAVIMAFLTLVSLLLSDLLNVVVDPRISYEGKR